LKMCYSFGAMVTVDDHRDLADAGFDFLELLVRSGDDLGAIGEVLDAICGGIVHAPERLATGEGGIILDLASTDKGISRASVDRLKEIGRMLSIRDIPLVVHPGGVGSQRERGRADLLHDSLGELEGRIWLENMPSRYHFDSQLLHSNLMTSPQEFDTVIDVIDGIVLDTSHAYLSAPVDGNLRVRSFIDHLGGMIRHVHLSDARHPDREGLQILEGDVDFSFLPRLKGLPILLEVWGGHMHRGRGFRKALGTVRSQSFERWFL
jgi:sugar phosphate isomerase/epimerase